MSDIDLADHHRHFPNAALVCHVADGAEIPHASTGVFGPRDTPMPTQGTAARLERAYRNFMETFPLFAAVLLAVVLQNKSGGVSHWGVILYVVARIVYMPLYAFGVKYVRLWPGSSSMVGIMMLISPRSSWTRSGSPGTAD